MAAPNPVFFSSESASVKALRRAVRSTRVRFPSGASRPRSYRTPRASSPSRRPSHPPPLVPSSQPLVLPRVSLEFARAGNKTRRQSNCPHENKKELTMAAENSRSSTRLRSTDALTSSSMRAKSALFFASASSRSASARVDSYFSRSSAASVRRSISAWSTRDWLASDSTLGLDDRNSAFLPLKHGVFALRTSLGDPIEPVSALLGRGVSEPYGVCRALGEGEGVVSSSVETFPSFLEVALVPPFVRFRDRAASFSRARSRSRASSPACASSSWLAADAMALRSSSNLSASASAFANAANTFSSVASL